MITSFFSQITVPPFNLTIVGNIGNELHSAEGKLVNLTCTVNSGIPKERLLWSTGNHTLVSGSEEIQYTFVSNARHHLKIYTCKVQHEALNEPSRKSVQLILPCKYLLS